MSEVFHFNGQMSFDENSYKQISTSDLTMFYKDVRKMVADKLHCTPLIITVDQVQLTTDYEKVKFDYMRVCYTINLTIDYDYLKKGIEEILSQARNVFEVRRIKIYSWNERELAVDIMAVYVNGAGREEARECFDMFKVKDFVKRQLISCITPVILFRADDY